MGKMFDDIHMELNCLDDFLKFLNENEVDTKVHNGGILFDIDEGSKMLIKKENGILQPILVPDDLETMGLILSILLERSKSGNYILFGYLITFLKNAGIDGVWNKDENIFKVYESENVWYIIGCNEDGISVNKFEGY
jgi:hypothetical protein